MSKLDSILGQNIQTYEGGSDKLMFTVDLAKQQIKELFLEIIGENQSLAEERAEYKPDYIIDGQNLLRAELRQKVEKL